MLSFNQGLGVVSAKYAVALAELVNVYHPRVHGKRFPVQCLNNNYDISEFKLAMADFRGLQDVSAEHVIRDIKRFLGSFVFSNEAGRDLPNLLVPIF